FFASTTGLRSLTAMPSDIVFSPRHIQPAEFLIAIITVAGQIYFALARFVERATNVVAIVRRAQRHKRRTVLMPIQLSLGLTSNPRTCPIIDGRAKADGIELIPTVLHPSELFWRQLHHAEFAVSEMSVSSLMIAKCRGDDRFVGVPVFTTRMFFHAGILVRRKAGIEKPSDLKGKRVGIPEYQQTAALWIRGVLQHEFGVSPQDMEFWMERPPARSHGGATGFKAPPGVTIHTIPDEKNIGSMMLSGELDAALFYLVDANPIDRSKVDLAQHPDIKWLFPDRTAETVRYYRKTGLHPINHMMVVRKDIAEKEAWVVLNVLKAFNRANDI